MPLTRFLLRTIFWHPVNGAATKSCCLLLGTIYCLLAIQLENFLKRHKLDLIKACALLHTFNAIILCFIYYIAKYDKMQVQSMLR